MQMHLFLLCLQYGPIKPLHNKRLQREDVIKRGAQRRENDDINAKCMLASCINLRTVTVSPFALLHSLVLFPYPSIYVYNSFSFLLIHKPFPPQPKIKCALFIIYSISIQCYLLAHWWNIKPGRWKRQTATIAIIYSILPLYGHQGRTLEIKPGFYCLTCVL